MSPDGVKYHSNIELDRDYFSELSICCPQLPQQSPPHLWGQKQVKTSQNCIEGRKLSLYGTTVQCNLSRFVEVLPQFSLQGFTCGGRKELLPALWLKNTKGISQTLYLPLQQSWTRWQRMCLNETKTLFCFLVSSYVFVHAPCAGVRVLAVGVSSCARCRQLQLVQQPRTSTMSVVHWGNLVLERVKHVQK